MGINPQLFKAPSSLMLSASNPLKSMTYVLWRFDSQTVAKPQQARDLSVTNPKSPRAIISP